MEHLIRIIITMAAPAALLTALQWLADKHLSTPAYRARLWKNNRRKWLYNDQSGEWQKRSWGGQGGAVLVYKATRAQRVLLEDKWLNQRMISSFVFHAIALNIFLVSYKSRGDVEIDHGIVVAIGWAFKAAVALEAFVWCWEVLYWLGFPQWTPNRGAMVIDPPAREWQADTFGPETITGTTSAKPQADLSYKPNE